MVVVYVVLAVAVVAAIYFLFLRPAAPSPTEELTPGQEPTGEKLSTPRLSEARKPKSEPAASEATEPARAEPEAPLAKSIEQEHAAPDARQPSEKPSKQSVAAAAVTAREPDASQPPVAVESEGGEPESLLRAKMSGPPSVAHVRNVEGLRRGLQKSRSKDGFFGRLLSLFSGKKEIDPNITAQLEEVLLASDVGTKTTEVLLGRVRERLSRGDLADTDAVWAALKDEILRVLSVSDRPGAFSMRDKPTVVLLVGVNGAGKTTTIGKLATRLKSEGRNVILAAGDTFRAAAVQQLVVWGSRVGAEVVRGKAGVDPGSVIFDAVQRAKQVGADIVLADTAGRLHTKANLMAELKKVVKTTSKALEGAPHEILLVVDATNGQNAMAQAAEFQQAMPLTGVVLTKLDGTAKGGVVLGISDSLGLPVRFVGLGETANDLHDFVPEEFVEALLGRE